MGKKTRQRVCIERVRPSVDGGRFPAKRVQGETVTIQADIFTDGHDTLAAEVLLALPGERHWQRHALQARPNDVYTTSIFLEHRGEYVFRIQAWRNVYQTWLSDALKKYDAGQDVAVELQAGGELVRAMSDRLNGADQAFALEQAGVMERFADSSPEDAFAAAQGDRLRRLLRYAGRSEEHGGLSPRFVIDVDRPRAGFSAWYEFFPRSFGEFPGAHGTLTDAAAMLPHIAHMGFDVVYLPPVHPIGHTFRKGRNNAPEAEPGDPGSPWAIGSGSGGHKAVHPDLGTLEDFEGFVREAERQGLEVALDLAFQCSYDHPYVREHPEWFSWLPDGSIRYAENPPKKYQDVVPLNFDCADWENLWEELKSVVLFWCERGVRIFRVDNPHTKPLRFWDWCIAEVRKVYPDTLFLAEAFTRPKVMYRLAKGGFNQSYTYFTWRNSKTELRDYLEDLVEGAPRDFFRPNFWPNTPDILPEFLQHGGRPAFVLRLVLAATLSSNYGMYGPAFELCEAEAVPGREEYAHSEKFELKAWDWNRPGHLREVITAVNRIRRANPALHSTWNVRFVDTDSDQVLAYVKTDAEAENIILVVASLDPFQPQTSTVSLPLDDLGVSRDAPYLVHDLLGEEYFFWQGDHSRLTFYPQSQPARIFRLHKRMRREQDFDYFM